MGGVVLPPLIASVLPSLGWREVWRIGALIVAVVLVPLIFLVVRQRPTEREGFAYVPQETAATGESGAEGGGAQIGWREVMARKNFWFVVCAYLPLMGMYAAYGQNLAPHAASHGLSPQAAGMLLSLFSGTHLLATFSLGPISDRFGVRLPFMGLAFLVAAGAVILAFSASVAAITLGCVMVGLAGGFNTMQAVAIAAEFGSRNFGRAYGMSFLFLPLGSAMAVVVAKVQEATGSYTPGLLGVAVLVLIGGFLSLLLEERPKVAVAIGH
jgi:MFS family permease